jgi:hypothetical protein
MNKKLNHKKHYDDKLKELKESNHLKTETSKKNILETNYLNNNNSESSLNNISGKKKFPTHSHIWNKNPSNKEIEFALNPLGERTGGVKISNYVLIKKTDPKVLASLNKPFKPKGYVFTKENYERIHPGTWFFSPTDQIDCWSCCMNHDKDSEGCVKNLISGGKTVLD